MKAKFRIAYLEEAEEFIGSLDKKTQAKIIYNLGKAQIVNDHELLKKLNGEIWEFRTLYNKLHLRLFAFWDKTERTDTLVICTHGIIKKTDKTPHTEIEKAEELRKLYFEFKLNKK